MKQKVCIGRLLFRVRCVVHRGRLPWRKQSSGCMQRGAGGSNRRPTHNVKIILGIPFLPKFFHDDDIPSPMLSPRSRLITD